MTVEFVVVSDEFVVKNRIVEYVEFKYVCCDVLDIQGSIVEGASLVLSLRKSLSVELEFFW